LVKDERADMLLQQLILFWVIDGRLKDIQLSLYHLSLTLISFRLLINNTTNVIQLGVIVFIIPWKALKE
jgi:hypothetical protein